MTKSNAVLPSSLSWPPSWWIFCTPEGWPWGHWWVDCMCKVSVLLASSLLPVHMLGAVCDTGGNLKPSYTKVPWGHFGENLSPLDSAARSARTDWDQIRAGLGGPGWSATWLACLQVVFLCEFCPAWWRCASQSAPMEKSESGPQACWSVVLLKGTLVSIWSNAALPLYPLSTHGVASPWKWKKKIEHCLLQLGFYKVPMGIKHTIPSGSF